MRIMLAAPELSLDDINVNSDRIISYIRKAGKNNVSLVLFSEASLTGFESMTFEYRKDIVRTLSVNGSEISRIRKAAIDNNVAVGFGFHENHKGGIYSSYMVTGKDGQTVDLYRRVSNGWRKSDACADYREGHEFHSFIYEGVRFTTIICGDLWEDNLVPLITELEDETDVFLWPVHCDISYYKWNEENTDFSDSQNMSRLSYAHRSSILSKPVLFINTFAREKDRAKGGLYHWHLGKEINSLEMGKEGYLITEV